MSWFSWGTSRENPEVEALKAANTALLQVIETLTHSERASTAALQTLLDGFKISSPPSVRVANDFDDYKREQEMIANEVSRGNLPGPDFSWVLTGETEQPWQGGDS